MEKINLAYRRKDDLLDGVMLVKTVAARKSSNGGQIGRASCRERV